MLITIPISAAELFDKITILEIKERYAQGFPDKLANVQKELGSLKQLIPTLPDPSLLPAVEQLVNKLRVLNHNIWVVEEGLRHLEKFNNFSSLFILLARQAYINNDQRFQVKKALNDIFKSEVVEEKIYGV